MFLGQMEKAEAMMEATKGDRMGVETL